MIGDIIHTDHEKLFHLFSQMRQKLKDLDCPCKTLFDQTQSKKTI